MIRKFLHFIVVITAGILWVVAYCVLVMCALLILLADKLYPNATDGNCWTFAGPKWMRYGGYLAVRKISDNSFMKVFPVIHVIWIKEFNTENKLEQAIPIKRSSNKWLPYRVFYFPFRISRTEKPHNATSE